MVLPDLIQANLRLVVCGVGAGRLSSSSLNYYSHPSNLFYKTLFEVGLVDRVLVPAEYRVLLNYGIGLTDLSKTHIGSDKSFRASKHDIEHLTKLIDQYAPRVLCFNGKRAFNEFMGVGSCEYGVQYGQLNETTIFVATSTSSRNTHWDISYWHDLFNLINSNSR